MHSWSRDDVAESITSYVGSGIDDDISMFKGIIQFISEDYEQSVENMTVFLEKNPTNLAPLQLTFSIVARDSSFHSKRVGRQPLPR